MPGRPAYWRNLGTNVTPDESISAEDLASFAESTQTDDFFYDAEPVTKYDTDGTFGTVTGSGGIVDWTTGTSAGNRAGIANAANGTVDPTKKLVIKARAGIGVADDEELFAFIGATEALPTAADPPVEADDAIYFRLVETTADANWFAVTRESTTETAVDTGIAIDTALHDFEIVLNSGSAVFKIDGVQVATSSTNLPLVALLPLVKIVTGDTDAKEIKVDSLTVSNSRA